jgi:hypothetical protein
MLELYTVKNLKLKIKQPKEFKFWAKHFTIRQRKYNDAISKIIIQYQQTTKNKWYKSKFGRWR